MLEEAFVTELTETLIITPPTLPTIAILPSLGLETQPSDTKKSDSEMIGQNTIWTKDWTNDYSEGNICSFILI